jgi:hypothetical protein
VFNVKEKEDERGRGVVISQTSERDEKGIQEKRKEEMGWWMKIQKKVIL